MFDFSGEILSAAVEKAFENRNTAITQSPAVFDPSFGKDGNKKAQWQGFIKKAMLTNAPESFGDVIDAVKVFLEPLVVSFGKRRMFRSTWTAPGPWQ